MSNVPDYYKVLGVTQGANDVGIKTAFRTLALRYHPDKNKAPNAVEKFIEVREAFEILSDPHKRSVYDSMRVRQSQPRPSARPRQSTSSSETSSTHRSNAGPSQRAGAGASREQETSGEAFERWKQEARKKAQADVDTEFDAFSDAVEWMLGEQAGAYSAIAGRGCFAFGGLFLAFISVVGFMTRPDSKLTSSILLLISIVVIVTKTQEALAIRDKHLK